MKKIALAGSFNFTDDQKARLEAIADVHTVEATSANDWAEKVKGYDVICTWGDYVLEKAGELQNVLITYPYTELGSFDAEELAKKNVYIANAKGGNRKSIAEWAMFSILSLFRQFPVFLRTTIQHPVTSTESLEGKNVVILGHGTIGTEVGDRCKAFGMNVSYFEHGDNLLGAVQNADVVLNALNCNSSTKTC